MEPAIDIGAGSNPFPFLGIRSWDRNDGDALLMEGIPDESYKTVYSAHCLEDISDAFTALRNWWRILKPGGHLILCVPHRDLYEKSIELPSKFNASHRTMWLPFKSQPPCTFSVLDTVNECCPNNFFLSLRVYDKGTTNTESPDEHTNGESTIEIIVRKR
jgi:SAM-dependent methyltransferase